MKLLKNDISSQLSEIFNISFSSGVFSSVLKTAKVFPVHKKVSKLDFSNYHPIILLFTIENFLERLMYNGIYKFFSDNNLIYSLQLDFKQKYSTVYALISPTENIGKNLNEGNIGCGILSTYRKHLILLSMIFFYQRLNITVCAVLLMIGLNPISQIEKKISINDYDSNLGDVKFGVTQRSVLGPLLFLIYNDYLNQVLKLWQVHHFADDTNLLLC